jgi:glycerophosphoryl diester phosphodiesterase
LAIGEIVPPFLVSRFLDGDHNMPLEIVGHRGASGEAPENTLASINLGWTRQADAVEIDVRLTGDGQIVSFHDASTLRITGKDHAVATTNLSELQQLDAGIWKGEQWAGERIPTLEEVLATVSPGKRLFVEIKCGREIVPEMLRILQKSAMERVVLISFHLDVLAELKRRLPEVLALQVVELAKSPKNDWESFPTLAERIGPAKQAGLDGFDIGATPLFEPAAAQRLLAEGFQLCTWTINDPTEARRLESMGVQAVTTDFPGKLRQELGL